jgi:serine O-acetyltransferase
MDLTETLREDLAESGGYWMSRWTLVVWRTGQWLRQIERRWWRPYAIRACKLAHVVWIDVLVGAEMPTTVRCGPGLKLMHGGRGVILNHGTIIGSHCVIHHGVTLGAGSAAGAPVIGNDVFIGAGASVLGPVTVGDGARIGAGAVVVHDVPAGATVVGVPARAVLVKSKVPPIGAG